MILGRSKKEEHGDTDHRDITNWHTSLVLTTSLDPIALHSDFVFTKKDIHPPLIFRYTFTQVHQ